MNTDSPTQFRRYPDPDQAPSDNQSIPQQPETARAGSQPPGLAQAQSGPAEKPKRLQLSLSQVMGGSLAAITAAALGSRLGVAGTVIGAGMASVIAAVASAVYTASLHRTRDKVQEVWTNRGWTRRVRVKTTRGSRTPVETTLTTAPAASPLQPGEPRQHGRYPWRAIVVGALAAFALAGVGITGIEAITGHPLSGGNGTTIQKVTNTGGSGQRQQHKQPTDNGSATPDQSQPSGTATPSTAPSQQQEPGAPEQNQTAGPQQNQKKQGSGQ